LNWTGLVCPVVPIRLPARGTAQQVANSSRAGTTRRRFRPSWRISQPLSEFALLGSRDPASKLPHRHPGPNRPGLAVKWGPTEWPISHSPTHVLTQKQAIVVGKSGGDRDSSWAVVCKTLWPRRRPRRRDGKACCALLGGRDDCLSAAAKLNQHRRIRDRRPGIKPQDKVSRLRCPFSVPGHRSVGMLGMLVVVFGRDNVARPGFLLG
jgi:hypothetical protein